MTVRGRARACGRTIDGKLKTDLKQEQIINNNNNKKKKKFKKWSHCPSTYSYHLRSHVIIIQVYYNTHIIQTPIHKTAARTPSPAAAYCIIFCRGVVAAAERRNRRTRQVVARRRFIESFARRVQTCAVLCPQTGHSRSNKKSYVLVFRRPMV